MKKKNIKKLTVTRETVRVLIDKGEKAGGGTGWTADALCEASMMSGCGATCEYGCYGETGGSAFCVSC